jgi:hypothetical protein
MGEVAGSNRNPPETIALSLTILELLLETGFICGLLCKIMLRRIPASTQNAEGWALVEVFDGLRWGREARGPSTITSPCSVVTDRISLQS